MANLTQLQRVPVVVPDTMDGLVAAIGQAAAEKLNYHAATNGTRRHDRDRELRQAVQAIGSAPFTDASVRAYQRAQVRPPGLIAARVLLGPGLLGLVGLFVFWSWQATTAIGIAYLVAAGVAFIGCGAAIVPLWAPPFQARWVTVPLARTDTFVPAFALQTALLLKQALPQVEFEIERLISRAEQAAIRREASSEERARRARPVDPFLVACYGDTRLYLEVWDEPDFEGRRKA